jgi:hypothetical protein
MNTYWGVDVYEIRVFLPWHQLEVSGHLHAPAALPQGKERLVPIG